MYYNLDHLKGGLGPLENSHKYCLIGQKYDSTMHLLLCARTIFTNTDSGFIEKLSRYCNPLARPTKAQMVQYQIYRNQFSRALTKCDIGVGFLFFVENDFIRECVKRIFFVSSF